MRPALFLTSSKILKIFFAFAYIKIKHGATLWLLCYNRK